MIGIVFCLCPGFLSIDGCAEDLGGTSLLVWTNQIINFRTPNANSCYASTWSVAMLVVSTIFFLYLSSPLVTKFSSFSFMHSEVRFDKAPFVILQPTGTLNFNH